MVVLAGGVQVVVAQSPCKNSPTSSRIGVNRGKHCCVVKIHFGESAQNVLRRVQGIQVVVPHNTITHIKTQ